jgi:AcrR family transcriptional regulator
MESTDFSQASEPTTRCLIIQTAERFFRQMGYQKTTVADIAKALRMSPANVYRFFDSKKAINEAVAERLMREVEGKIEEIARGPGSAEQRLREMIRTMHAMNTTLYTQDLRMHEMVERALSESWEVVHAHIERKNVIFQRVVEEGMATGEFRVSDPGLASHCVQLALVRFFHPALLVQCATVPGPTLEQMADFVLAALSRRSDVK